MDSKVSYLHSAALCQRLQLAEAIHRLCGCKQQDLLRLECDPEDPRNHIRKHITEKHAISTPERIHNAIKTDFILTKTFQNLSDYSILANIFILHAFQNSTFNLPYIYHHCNHKIYPCHQMTMFHSPHHQCRCR